MYHEEEIVREGNIPGTTHTKIPYTVLQNPLSHASNHTRTLEPRVASEHISSELKLHSHTHTSPPGARPLRPMPTPTTAACQPS